MAYDFDPDVEGTIRSHIKVISDELQQRSESNDNACDKVFEQYRKAAGNLREIESGIALLNRLKTVEEKRFDLSWKIHFGSEQDCASYTPAPYGETMLETGELRYEVRLMIGFLQALEQEISAEEDPIREGPRIRGDAPTINDYIRGSGFVPPDGC